MLTFTEFLIEKEFDEDKHRWITIKDKQMQNQHVMLNKKDGTIAAGMGGKHNGEKISSVYKDDSKKETTPVKNNEEPSKKETKKSAKDIRDKFYDLVEVGANNASTEASMYKMDIDKAYKKLSPENKKKAKSLIDDANNVIDKIASIKTSLSKAGSMFNLIDKGKTTYKSSDIYKLVSNYNKNDIIDAGDKFAKERMDTINAHLKKLNSIEKEINNLK